MTGLVLRMDAETREQNGKKERQEDGGQEDGLPVGVARFANAGRPAIFLSSIFLSLFSVFIRADPRHPRFSSFFNKRCRLTIVAARQVSEAIGVDQSYPRNPATQGEVTRGRRR